MIIKKILIKAKMKSCLQLRISIKLKCMFWVMAVVTPYKIKMHVLGYGKEGEIVSSPICQRRIRGWICCVKLIINHMSSMSSMEERSGRVSQKGSITQQSQAAAGCRGILLKAACLIQIQILQKFMSRGNTDFALGVKRVLTVISADRQRRNRYELE